MKRKVALKTLGCRLNQFETDSILTDFYRAGYEIVSFSEKADVYLINTCTVTNQSDQKSRNIINHAVRNANSKSVIIVTGCMIESRKELLKGRSDITYLVDNTRKASIIQLVEAHFRGEIIQPEELEQDVFNFNVVEKSFHTRCAIKIQDGCDNFCSFCIVPTVRGAAISRPINDILENIRKIADLGNKEIILTGVNISRYKYEKYSFEDLVDKILKLPGDFRLRVSSIEPERFSNKLIDLFNNPKLCPHLHLCLQSGSNEVLKRMKRFYTVEQYLHLTGQFAKLFPLFNFTTDIIVGFPGETDQEFTETCKIIKQIGFSHIHTFKYSKRTGTKAAEMSLQVLESTKNIRSMIIRHISDENKLIYRRNFIGVDQTVLIEQGNGNKGFKGYGQHYIPILINNPSLNRNAFYKVKIVDVLDDKEKTVIGITTS